jgi:hypothetical protein
MKEQNEQHEYDYERQVDAALRQIADFSGGSREYLKWYGDLCPANREALELLRRQTMREAMSVPPGVFCGLMAMVVGTHFYLHSLWKHRDQMHGNFPAIPSVNLN